MPGTFSYLELLIGDMNNTREPTNVPLAIPKWPRTCTETPIFVASRGEHRDTEQVFKKPKLLLWNVWPQMMILGIWRFLAYSNNNDDVRSLPGDRTLLRAPWRGHQKPPRSAYSLRSAFWILPCCSWAAGSSIRACPLSFQASWPALPKVLGM